MRVAHLDVLKLGKNGLANSVSLRRGILTESRKRGIQFIYSLGCLLPRIYSQQISMASLTNSQEG